ncbi:MAG: ATP-dependent DNA helicase Rep [Gammaproteobacteria bacterium]|nr:MAG: ATP-dependent DNA helicase Rep [Gammaproteobacteria bacterium]
MQALNPPQREAVRRVDRHVLVLAGAGSGKTRVITEKIVRLLSDHAVPAEAIAAVTFTNKAAQEMRRRVAERVGRAAAGLWVGTFHGLGLAILRRHARRLGYKPGLSVFDGQDVQSVLKALLEEDPGGYGGDEGAAAWAIGQLKNRLIDPEAAAAAAEDAQQAALAALYARYERQLRAYNAVDFDDLIRLPVRLLNEDAEARANWAERLQHLLVDEYQDTNPAQYALVRALLAGGARLTAVGDDDQSIYAWRGACSDNLRRLLDDFPGIEVVKLEQNYRCSGAILACANHLIRNNPHLFEKRLWSELGWGEPVRVIACDTAEAEAERVVAEILHLKFQKRLPAGAFAILYRSNHQSRLFEGALRLHDLPYQVSGGTAFFERAEIKDLLAYLRLLANPDDDAAFLRIVNTPRREIGAATLERLGALATAQGCSLLEAVGRAGSRGALGAAAHTRLARFADWVAETARAAAGENAAVVLERLIDDLGYRDWLQNSVRDAKAAEARLKNVEDLLDWVRRLVARQEDGPFGLEDLVGRLALMDLIERNEGERARDAVQLMTLHAAKGLEFDHVFLVGLEEGLLPHQNSLEGEAVEEERRLAYVGLTRARRGLTLTYARRRKRQGEWIDSTPSRFLDELPADALRWEGVEEADPHAARERGRARLASLRAMLDKAAEP